MRVFPARTIIEDEHVSADIDEATKRYPRCGDVWEALKWDLARVPDKGAVQMGPYWMKKSLGWAVTGVPVIAALYKFDETSVEIVGVRITRHDENG